MAQGRGLRIDLERFLRFTLQPQDESKFIEEVGGLRLLLKGKPQLQLGFAGRRCRGRIFERQGTIVVMVCGHGLLLGADRHTDEA